MRTDGKGNAKSERERIWRAGIQVESSPSSTRTAHHTNILKIGSITIVLRVPEQPFNGKKSM